MEWLSRGPSWTLVVVTSASELRPPHNLALGHAWLWAKASEVPAARLLGDGSGLPDALLLLLALRQVLRAAEMAQDSRLQNRRARQILNSAVARFKRDLPDLVDARDIIEHFDQYAVGKGDRQIGEKKADPPLTKAELAEHYAVRLEGTHDEPIVRVGPHSIKANNVPGAAGRLFEGIRAAARVEDGHQPR